MVVREYLMIRLTFGVGGFSPSLVQFVDGTFKDWFPQFSIHSVVLVA